jgi:trigger factor
MKTTIEEKSETQYVIRVEIPPDVVDRKLEEVYRRVVRTLEIPGFRKGRIPRGYLEMRFGKDFLYEDSQAELLEEYLPKALSEHNIEPASRPEPKVLEFEAGKPFRFEVEIEVFPEIEIADYSEIEVEAPPKREVSDDEVSKVMEELRIEHAVLVPRDSSAVVEAEDVVVIRHRDGKTEELQARSDGWTAALIGKRVGETVELEPPEGERVRVTVDGIKRIELPDLEELSQTLGHEDPASLKDEILRKLKERFEHDYEHALRMRVLDAVVEQSRVRVPKKLVEDLLEAEVEYIKRGGHEPSEEELTQLREAIERSLKRERLLQAIKEKEGLSLSDEEFEEHLQGEAKRSGVPLVKFKALLEREGQLERMRREHEDQRALELLLEKARIIQSTDPDEED